MLPHKPGLFISIEGIEGAGKSTLILTIQRVLEQAQVPYCLTREPGGTPIAEDIRHIFLGAHQEILDPMTELLLVFAARNQHVNTVIKPALAEGCWVVSDRFTDATYAYQGGGREMPIDQIAMMEQMVLNNFQPDQVLLLDLPVERASQRLIVRDRLDRIEQENLNFFQRVRNMYLNRSADAPSRYTLVNADQDIDQVDKSVSMLVEKWIAAWQI
jgi:dTMP kinase